MMHSTKPHPSHPGHRIRPPHQVFPQDIQCVVDSSSQHGAIYIGNLQAAENLQTLQKYNISSLLTACKDIHIRHAKQYVEYSLYIPGQDHEKYDLSLYFDTAVNFIHQSLKKTNILVHCMAGVSRSVTLVIAYLIKHKNMSFKQAFKMIQKRRRKINPNPGFIRQLQAYQQKINKTHYTSYHQEYEFISSNNRSFGDKNKFKHLTDQNLSYDSVNYKLNERSADQLKLRHKYEKYAKIMTDSNLQLSKTKLYNPEKEGYNRPRTNYQNKEDKELSYYKLSQYNNQNKMTFGQKDQKFSSTLTQIINNSCDISQRSFNIQNIEELSKNLQERINKIKEKYFQGREIRLNRSLMPSENQKIRNQKNTQSNRVGHQSFNKSAYNFSSGLRQLTRQYI